MKLLVHSADSEHRIAGIKELRAATKLGLREAKEIVDKLTGFAGFRPEESVDLSEYMTIRTRAEAERIHDALHRSIWINSRLEFETGDDLIDSRVAKLAVATAVKVTLIATPLAAADVLRSQVAALDADTAEVFSQAADLLSEIFNHSA